MSKLKIDRYFIIFNMDLLRVLLRLEKNSIITLIYLLNYENGFIQWNNSDISYIPYGIFKLESEFENERVLGYLNSKEITIKSYELNNGLNELVRYNILNVNNKHLSFNEKLIRFGWYDKTIFKSYLFISFEQDVILKFYQLPLASIRILLRCLIDMDFADYDRQIIRFTKEYKNLILDELKYSFNTINQSINNLRKLNLLIRKENTKYIVNPEFIFKGSISDRKILIDYCNKIKDEKELIENEDKDKDENKDKDVYGELLKLLEDKDENEDEDEELELELEDED